VVARRRAPAWPRLRCSAGRADLAWSRAQGAEKEQRRGLPEAVTARGGGGRARLRLGIPETTFGGGTRRRGRRPWRGALLRSGTKRKREPAKEKIKATYGMHMIQSVHICICGILASNNHSRVVSNLTLKPLAALLCSEFFCKTPPPVLPWTEARHARVFSQSLSRSGRHHLLVAGAYIGLLAVACPLRPQRNTAGPNRTFVP
jgi:hypothetical protein